MGSKKGKTVLLMGAALTDAQERLHALLSPEWEIRAWRPADGLDALRAQIRRADVLVPGPDALLAGTFHKTIGEAERLQLLQIPFAGVEWLDPALLPGGCLVCNAAGHETAIAEYVMGALLRHEIRFDELDADFRAGSWRHRGAGKTGLYQGEVRGKTLGIIGFGAIGRAIAQRAAAFDMRVIAVSRSERACPPGLSWYGTLNALPRLLKESDYIVLACDLNETTRGLLGPEQFAAMKPSAVLVNVARGKVADEAALFTALKTGQIAGAVLDVWYVYPPGSDPTPAAGGPKPSRFEFASLDNVLMTPHCAARTRESDVRRMECIAENLNRFARGEPPLTVVMT
ncbi:MAG: 2-hydroxyacid dehydrogenase, partial [bacterium]